MTNIPPAPEAKWGPGAEQDRYGSRFGLRPEDAEQLKSSLAGGPGAEQERYASRFGLRPGNAESIKTSLTDGPGAEQERYGSKFGVKEENASWFRRSVTSGSGAEQERYASHWGGLTEEDAARVKSSLTSGPGAEQDRYASHWGISEERAARIKRGLSAGPGAEQDRYASHWGLSEDTADRIKRGLTSGPGAEQERYGSHWGLSENATARVKQGLSRNDLGPGAEQDRYGARFGVSEETVHKVKEATGFRIRPGQPSASEQDRLGSHFSIKPTNPIGPGSVGLVGILQSTILPTLAMNSGLSLITYLAGRYADRVDIKDAVRPLTPVINAWWMAVGRRMFYFGIPFSRAWDEMAYPEKMLLAGVTVQGLKLFSQSIEKSISRGEDEPRYEAKKKQETKFWNKAALSLYVPEAVLQTLVSLPFTLAFRLGPSVALAPAPAFAELAHNLAVFLFGSGFALQTIADVQLAAHNKNNPSTLNTQGAWSIVRHPNYLGDFHVYASFPLLLYSCGLLHPLAIAAPVATYFYTRYISGDIDIEKHHEETYQTKDVQRYNQLQAYKSEKNAFWPRLQELKNPWYLTVAGVGIGCVILERGVREYILR